MTDKIVENDRGGKQSQISGKMTEVPPIALKAISRVMGEGSARYPREDDGTPNWYKIGCKSNLDHGLLHLANFLEEMNKPRPDEEFAYEELTHFGARAMMAVEQFCREGYDAAQSFGCSGCGWFGSRDDYLVGVHGLYCPDCSRLVRRL